LNIILNSIKQAANSSKERKMEVYSAVSILTFYKYFYDFTSKKLRERIISLQVS